MTLLYFIIAISLLVVIHEFGHFWVARRCGVQVLRFSVGFGKPFWSFTDKHGTEFAVAPIPLGGYVKMLDEREAPVPEHLLDQAFNRKSPWARIAIASAGPIANFIFALLAYWLLFVSGTSGFVPVVGTVADDSVAAVAGVRSGDEIVAVNDHETTTWQEVSWQLVGFLGEDADIRMTLKSADGTQRSTRLQLNNWLTDQEVPDPLAGLGIEPRRLDIPAVVGEVQPGGAAAAAGIQPGDHVVAINGSAVADWYDWVEHVRAAPGKALQLTLKRNDALLDMTLTPGSKTLDDGSVIGFVGAGVVAPEIPSDWVRTSHAGVVQGLLLSVNKTIDLVVFTLDSLWKMLLGDVSVKNLSGPITIAKVAGDSASGGLEAFIGFLALLSISLGVLNLLPVPMLDGGHILFYLVEVIRGRPLPERVQIIAVQFGLFLLLSLMLVAFYNDISRL
ncbi:RIP metalloprotease RseP [Thalassolituus hydrocarboniclasticus]|uniref:Zinc metalloprotease n=1 Tax=Thalassolituus hydrocarboniclasticus TaxID=2742796 RepID=A0ABY6AAW9_9GAMM|nr:RIP metalloprotease RseP [Thalassolituus hydrocarboniclasticus]UXD88171.1 RIP metalloprotease RseP [Thalassolituus hydrocarboniclasticus]